MSPKKFAPKLFALLVVVSLLATFAVTFTPTSAQSATDDNAPITVWIDQPRQPMMDAYLKANPDKASLIKTVVVDREQFPSKVLLFNNTNQGWPDVVFAEPRLVGRVADVAHQFPLDLTSLVSPDIMKDYAGMAGCTFGDKIYCLRNDLAQFVVYYNKPLMDKFGYTVPQTFDDLQALSDKVAKDHPGYLLGTFGDGWTFLSFFDASGCPSHELVNDNELKIDPTDPRCIRAAKLVDHMLANGTLWNTDYFNASFVKELNDNKFLMASMPAWIWGTFAGTYYTSSEHQLAISAPLKWAADDASAWQTPAMGGGAWTVSQHTKNPKLAVALITFLTTSPDVWTGPTATNFPAYKPLMPVWEKAVASNPIWATDPYSVMSAAAEIISPLDKWPRFDLISPLNQLVTGAQTDKATIESVLPQVVTLFQPLAEADGYQVDAPSS